MEEIKIIVKDYVFTLSRDEALTLVQNIINTLNASGTYRKLEISEILGSSADLAKGQD